MSISNPIQPFDQIQIGQTPLLRFPHLEPNANTRIYAKAEWQQLGGSVKARPALQMLREAVNGGKWRPGMRMLDATSGNTGIAYAVFCERAGIPLTLFLPENASPERINRLRGLGVDLRLTGAMDGTDGAQAAALDFQRSSGNRSVYLDQYSNDANWKAHYATTGPEILCQTRGRLTHFVAGLGTTGTFTGVTRFLKSSASPAQIKCISLQPDSALHGMEGWKHLETAHVPAIYDAHLADEVAEVSTEAAYDMIERVFSESGLLLSPSSAANLAGTVQVARHQGPGCYATILADDATKYADLYKRLNIKHG